MDKENTLPNNLKEALSIFNQGFQKIEPLLESMDKVVEYMKNIDAKLDPVYEKFKYLNDIFEKIDLINRTMIRVVKYGSLQDKNKDNSFPDLFR